MTQTEMSLLEEKIRPKLEAVIKRNKTKGIMGFEFASPAGTNQEWLLKIRFKEMTPDEPFKKVKMQMSVNEKDFETYTCYADISSMLLGIEELVKRREAVLANKKNGHIKVVHSKKLKEKPIYAAKNK